MWVSLGVAKGQRSTTEPETPFSVYLMARGRSGAERLEVAERGAAHSQSFVDRHPSLYSVRRRGHNDLLGHLIDPTAPATPHDPIQPASLSLLDNEGAGLTTGDVKEKSLRSAENIIRIEPRRLAAAIDDSEPFEPSHHLRSTQTADEATPHRLLLSRKKARRLRPRNELCKAQVSQPLSPVLPRWPQELTASDRAAFRASPQAFALLVVLKYP
jgi:hypothetical protein